MKFNEWLTQRDGNNSGDLAADQLSLFVDRIVGILHYTPDEKRMELVEKFIGDLKARLSE